MGIEFHIVRPIHKDNIVFSKLPCGGIEMHSKTNRVVFDKSIIDKRIGSKAIACDSLYFESVFFGDKYNQLFEGNRFRQYNLLISDTELLLPLIYEIQNYGDEFHDFISEKLCYVIDCIEANCSGKKDFYILTC